MISGALTRAARELTEAGAPFVIATVVRVERPTSVDPGDGALVRSDGTIEGFVGGVCAQHSVRLYSLQAIESGKPVLLRILPDGPGRGADTDAEEDPERTEEISDENGTVTVQNPCLSGGAIEVFLEPVLPAPRVLVAGDSPIVAALRRIGPELGLAMVAGGAPAPGDLALVVAAHGRDELGVLRAGLEAGVRYVGLVASRKRGGGVVDQLRELGLSEAEIGRVETPAGLDISARTAAEIALSILARIVEVRRSTAAPSAAIERPNTALDPVCGMTVVVGADTPSLRHAGQTIYFCCLGCKLKFEEQHGDAAVAG
jgi:xanthine dehydrogenase accessory factor